MTRQTSLLFRHFRFQIQLKTLVYRENLYNCISKDTKPGLHNVVTIRSFCSLLGTRCRRTSNSYNAFDSRFNFDFYFRFGFHLGFSDLAYLSSHLSAKGNSQKNVWEKTFSNRKVRVKIFHV